MIETRRLKNVVIFIQAILLLTWSFLWKFKEQSCRTSYEFFYFIWKETTYKPSKSATGKNVLSSVNVIMTTCFDKCFLFHVITGRHCFFIKVYPYSEVFSASGFLCSLKQVIWKKSVLYFLSPQCNANTKRKSSKNSRISDLLSFLYCF